MAKERVAKAITALYTFALIVTVVSWFVDRRPSRLLLGVVFGTLNIPASTSLVSAVVLALVVGALVRRKRVALIAVGLFQLVGIGWSAVLLGLRIGGALPGLPGAERALGYTAFVLTEGLAVVVGLALLWVVRWLRPAFPARLQPGSRRNAILVLVTGLVVSLVTTLVLLHIRGAAADTDDPADTVLSVLRRSLGIGQIHDAEVLKETGPVVPAVLEVLLAATLVVAIWVFLRSSRSGAEWSGDHEVLVRRLLARYGGNDSLGYFATRRDRSYIFSSDERAVVAFRLVGGVALAAGNPIGARDAWPSAVASWLETARRYGWLPAATSVRPDGARYLAGLGFNVAPLGDKAVLTADTFTLDSTSMTSVRRSVVRARRAGLTVTLRSHGQLTPDEMAEVVEKSQEWRRGGDERGFSMALNRLGDPADSGCLLVAARDASGRLVGLLSFVPWGTDGLSLDVMRRAPEAPNGVTELMVSDLMSRAEALGIRRVSLNFAVARQVFADAEKLGAGPIARVGSSLLGLLDRFTQVESLYRNNERYRPEWHPRFVCFDGTPAVLPTIAAIARAEGFLPSLGRGAPSGATLTPEQLRGIQAAGADAAPDEESVTPRRSDQTLHRLRHLEELRTAGLDPFRVGAQSGVALREFSWTGEGSVTVRGRVRRQRRHGGVAFVDLVDGSVSLQAVLESAQIGRGSLALFGRCIDVGDLVVLTGTRGASRNGTPSLLAHSWTIVAKALHPIPYGGLSDPGERARRRTTDLLVHPEAGERLRQRSAVIRSVREVLLDEGYLEVDTPVLVPTNGGATARPFRTHSNAYRVELLLRIAPELQLKRLLAGDLGPIFEIGRNFRNEGADLTHNPEFTVVEAYRPFADYTDMRLLTERIVRRAARAVHGAEVIPLPGAGGEEELTDVSGEWPVVTVCDGVSRALGDKVDHLTELDTLLRHARDRGVAVHDGMGPGAVLEELYGELVEPVTIRPTFFVDFPLETSPLTGPHRTKPGLVERWDLVIRGTEVGTAYSELNDPLEQRRRLTAQSLKAAAGDLEAMELDEDFLVALETGMPPAGGLGIGLDRLAMLLTSSTIRQVLSFPFVRPHP